MVFHSVWYTVYGQENKPIKTNMKIEFAQIDMHKYKQSRNKRHFRLPLSLDQQCYQRSSPEIRFVQLAKTYLRRLRRFRIFSPVSPLS